jgi:lipoprotein NlpI
MDSRLIAAAVFVGGLLLRAGVAPATEPPLTAEALERRGSEHFGAGLIAESLADFDAELSLDPRRGPGHWKRGLSLYCLGRFGEGAKQFEGYQSVDSNDVENAVWRFACQARDPACGPARARREILPIGHDPRVPMMEVYRLFKGEVGPDVVMSAAGSTPVTADARAVRQFYAHLYLGLYHEATGDLAKARSHMLEADARRTAGDYMGFVAHVLAERMRHDGDRSRPAPGPER